MQCPIGNHLLRGPGVYITSPRLIRFVNKFFVDFLPSEKVCEKCKRDIENVYEYKMKRALGARAYNSSLSSDHSSEQSATEVNRNNQSNQNKKNTQKSLVEPSSTSTEDDGQPTTSAQAAAKRKRKEERQQNRKQQRNLLALNVQRRSRLPHIQPVARRRQFVSANPDIMDIYIRGMTGG